MIHFNKKVYGISLCLFIISLSAAAMLNGAAPLPAFNVKCIALGSDESMKIHISKHGKASKVKAMRAQRAALRMALYGGIGAGACGSAEPLLRNENERAAFSKIENDFWGKNGTWVRYVSGWQPLDDTSHTNGSAAFEMVIAIRPLRLYLQEKHIISTLNKNF